MAAYGMNVFTLERNIFAHLIDTKGEMVHAVRILLLFWIHLLFLFAVIVVCVCVSPYLDSVFRHYSSP